MRNKFLLLMLFFTFTTLFHGSRACEDKMSVTTPLRSPGRISLSDDGTRVPAINKVTIPQQPVPQRFSETVESGKTRIPSLDNSNLPDLQQEQTLPAETFLDRQTETVPPQQTPNIRIVVTSSAVSDTLLDTITRLADSMTVPCD